jgi:DNA mismatch repair protein MutS
VNQSKEIKPKEESRELTPMFKQYWDIKSNYPDTLLFFRLGDFYELFDNDALVGARELDITLTGRPEPSYPNGRVPMAGVPVKSLDVYISRLIAKGYSIALCEQVGVVGSSKGPVERKVTRILTPGTVLESNLLPARENNYLVALLKGETNKKGECLWGLAYVDASSGEFAVTELNESNLLFELARISPKEVLVAKRTIRAGAIPEEMLDIPKSIESKYRFTHRPAMFFNIEPSKRRIMQTFKVNTLEGFGCQNMPLAIGAAGAILEYLESTQGSQMPIFTGMATYYPDNFLVIDENTRRNLELTETLRDRSFASSLLWAIDKTQTAMGSRMLRNWLTKPLFDLETINERLNAIEELKGSLQKRQAISNILSSLSDLERLAVKLGSQTICPKDLLAVAESLAQLPKLQEELIDSKSKYLTALAKLPKQLLELADKVMNALSLDPPRELTQGEIFKAGYSNELDEIRSLLGGGKDWIESFQKKEQERTQIRSLKVSFNSTFGYYIEITHANKDAVPADYIRKQTLTNAERYITPDLKEYEAKILNAEQNQSTLEYKLYVDFRNSIATHGQMVSQVANYLAALDSLLSLTVTAIENNYTRPKLDNSLTLEIKDGRHPVLEKILPMGMFVANDTNLNGDAEENQMIILTGPNMSGKSSLLRQVAHIVLMAQMGSYVPAQYAHIGLVDRIFTRIGAVDDLTQGQSTFLVEMSETTQCCLSASKASLILLDEVGRGTSTYDGVAIAWAVAEYLANVVRARTIFATHYHELNGLTNFFSQISNFQVQVAEADGQVEFMHRVVAGGASRSFGIRVASMAGLPKTIIDRANQLMTMMERKSAASKILDGPKDGPKLNNVVLDKAMQLSLFTRD